MKKIDPFEEPLKVGRKVCSRDHVGTLTGECAGSFVEIELDGGRKVYASVFELWEAPDHRGLLPHEASTLRHLASALRRHGRSLDDLVNLLDEASYDAAYRAEEGAHEHVDLIDFLFEELS